MVDLKPILLVDDNPLDIELTLAALTECRFANEVVVARDGVEALDILLERGEFVGRAGVGVAFILLDLKLPRMDGIEVLEQMRAVPHLRRVPVVMMTGSNEEIDLTRSYTLGVNGYVVKPIEYDHYFSAIQDIMQFWLVRNEPPPTQWRWGRAF